MYFTIGLIFLVISGLLSFYARAVCLKLQDYSDDAKELEGTKVKEMNLFQNYKKYKKALEEEGINSKQVNKYVSKYRWSGNASFVSFIIFLILIIYHYTLTEVL